MNEEKAQELRLRGFTEEEIEGWDEDIERIKKECPEYHPIGSDTHICDDGTRISMLNPNAILRHRIQN